MFATSLFRISAALLTEWNWRLSRLQMAVDFFSSAALACAIRTFYLKKAQLEYEKDGLF
jgi:hypothetical protein